MKRIWLLLLAPAALTVAQPSPSAAKKSGLALPSAEKILERAAAAAGGIEAQKSIQTEKLVGKMSIPEQGISGPMTMYRSQRGEMYQILEIPGAGKVEVGNNGNVEWERSTLTGPKVRRVASEPGGLLQPDPTNVVLSDRFSKIETVGLGKVNGKPCFKVQEWPSGRGAMLTACYDRETFLPVQLEMNAARPPVKIVLGDYRAVGPVKLPFLIETETMGQTIRLELQTITLNDPLPPEAIGLPEEIEKLADRPEPNEIRELEVDKDRPVLRHRPRPQKKL